MLDMEADKISDKVLDNLVDMLIPDLTEEEYAEIWEGILRKL